MVELSNNFEGIYNPFEALKELLEKEKVRVLKAISSRGTFSPVDLGEKRPLKIGFAPVMESVQLSPKQQEQSWKIFLSTKFPKVKL